jgi:acetylglutamate kinase
MRIDGAKELIKQGVISGGMIPKVDCCIRSLAQGVRATHIIDGRMPHSILLELLTDEVMLLLVCHIIYQVMYGPPTHIIHGRMPHSILLELLTDEVMLFCHLLYVLPYIRKLGMHRILYWSRTSCGWAYLRTLVPQSILIHTKQRVPLLY